MKNQFFKLPFSFDTRLLKQDLAHCVAAEWTRHFNQKDFIGEWTGIALRSNSGTASDIHCNPNTEGYQDTALLAHSPYFQAVINQFDCEKEAIRLLSLNPNSHIKEHRDRGLGYEYGIFRLHIPITTDANVDFIVNQNQLIMHEGSCWYANFDLPHSVLHRGTQVRVHLVIDCKRNAWTDALFAESGYDFDHEKKSLQPSTLVKQQTIEHLKLMDTDTANQIIQQLEAEIAIEMVENTQNTEGGTFSIKSISKEWLPYKINADKKQIQWLYLNNKRFTEPFFENTLAQCKVHPFNSAKNTSSIAEMITASETIETVAPTAFIFHVSRCGSTLLSQLLGIDEQNIVVAEPPFIDTILKECPIEAIDAALKAAIKFLGTKRLGSEKEFFIKLDSWHLFNYATFRRLYPETPFILMYRKPHAVFHSHQKQCGMQAIPGMIEPQLLGLKPTDLEGINQGKYLGIVLENYYKTMFEFSKTDSNTHLIDYDWGTEKMLNCVSKACNLTFNEGILDRMRERSQFHAKHPHQVFDEKLHTENDNPDIYEAQKWYDKLEKLAISTPSRLFRDVPSVLEDKTDKKNTTFESNTSNAFEKAVNFLESIGIPVHFKSLETNCFLPGISIENGEIVVDKAKMKYPGDILHEAGHIAVVPKAERCVLNEHTIVERKDKDAEEMMAIAWSFAACKHLGLDASFVFHDEGYKGGGSDIANNFNEGHYFGVPMLQWVGMTFEKNDSQAQDKLHYPAMLQWLRS